MECDKQTKEQVSVQVGGAKHWLNQTHLTFDVRAKMLPLHLDYEAFPALGTESNMVLLV